MKSNSRKLSQQEFLCLSPQRQWLGLGDGPRLLCDGGERGDKEKFQKGEKEGGDSKGEEKGGISKKGVLVFYGGDIKVILIFKNGGGIVCEEKCVCVNRKSFYLTIKTDEPISRNPFTKKKINGSKIHNPYFRFQKSQKPVPENGRQSQ